MNLLELLWSLADDLAASGQTDGESFGECGLFLVRPLIRWQYSGTPLNTLTFASTGGDGLHYGFFLMPDFALDEQPIVMTVPGSKQCKRCRCRVSKRIPGSWVFRGLVLLRTVGL